MPNGRSFKSDESFLEKISMGAIGTRFVYSNLASNGHQPIELERGSRNFKIWKSIKIKRVRVPDILCVKCGTRVESRAKTKMEISMSHSTADPNRGWDFGLEDTDYVAIIRCVKGSFTPTDWHAQSPIQYIQLANLRKAYRQHKILQERPKGAEEGFETRIIWPTTIASSNGVVHSLTSDRIRFKRKSDDRTISVGLEKKKIKVNPLVKIGEEVVEGQILASVVHVEKCFKCAGDKDIESYIRLLTSSSISDRYAAIKAISNLDVKKVVDVLKKRMVDSKEHVYVRLEAAAALARIEDTDGIQYLTSMIKDEYLENRLETVIILGEINTATSMKLLTNTLADETQNPEIRAASAWSIGELGHPEAIKVLIGAFNAVDNIVKIEASKALAKFANSYTPLLLNQFKSASISQRSGIAWALGKTGRFTIDDIRSCLIDGDARQWVSYIIGTRNEDEFIKQIEEIKKQDPEVYFAVTVLWKIFSSWINEIEEFS
ncbi:MAG: HEAT repeat domain-containing protein [Euryarchaeota archaeon]|nr:HEAT repeat domain-containing protein [Euryarchaeota archaeon]